MWGVCLDISVPELFQRVVEYDFEKSVILRPLSDIKVSSDKIRFIENAPNFVYGEIVSPVNHTNITGKIHTIIWHFKRGEYCYYIEADGKKKSKRYYRGDLI
ncbi:MAG: hypothetical protein K2J40_00915 [Ruminococcus sp.]|nr:hypothetical protein [Ruminococcus sp.]